MCVNYDSSVSFKKGHTHSVGHAHAMLTIQHIKSPCKNHPTYADAFFSEKCAYLEGVHARARITISRLATTDTPTPILLTYSLSRSV